VIDDCAALVWDIQCLLGRDYSFANEVGEIIKELSNKKEFGHYK
jgi:hypothetical protein